MLKIVLEWHFALEWMQLQKKKKKITVLLFDVDVNMMCKYKSI